MKRINKERFDENEIEAYTDFATWQEAKETAIEKGAELYLISEYPTGEIEVLKEMDSSISLKDLFSQDHPYSCYELFTDLTSFCQRINAEKWEREQDEFSEDDSIALQGIMSCINGLLNIEPGFGVLCEIIEFSVYFHGVFPIEGYLSFDDPVELNPRYYKIAAIRNTNKIK